MADDDKPDVWGSANGAPMPINTYGAGNAIRSGAASGDSSAPTDKFDLQGDWKAKKKKSRFQELR